MNTYTPTNNEDWLSKRQGYIGASESPILFGYGFKSPLELYYDKLGIRINRENPLTQSGKYFESSIIQWFNDLTGKNIVHNKEQKMFFSSEHPFIMCTPDGLPLTEIKFSLWDDEFNESNYPDKYAIQCQHQMYVMELDLMYFVAWVKGKIYYWIIERNDRLIKLIVERCLEFWERIQAQNPPLADDSDSAILDLVSGDIRKAEEVELPETVLKLMETVPTLQAKINQGKKAEKALTEIKNQIKQVLMGAEIGTKHGKPVVWLKEIERKEHIVKASKFKTLVIGE